MEVLIDFEKVFAQVNQIEELAAALQQESTGNLESALTTVSGAWSGEAADAFLRKGMRFQEKVRKTADDLSRTAGVVREIAAVLQRAEQQAQEIAVTREY